MAARITSPSPMLVGSVHVMNLVRLSNTPRPSSTAASMVAKSSSVSTMSAASLATSVPPRPIATPMLACRNAGASLTPSPVIATTCPLACRASTRRNFCSGETRAKTLASSTRSGNSSALNAASCAPVITDRCPGAPGTSTPTDSAIALAVPGWSPVIIFTAIPAEWQAATAGAAASRGGSSMACRPVNVIDPDICASVKCDGSAGTATPQASTRRPSAASASAAATAAARSTRRSVPSASICRSHSSSMRSTEPLTSTTSRCRSDRCRVAMYWRSELNGIAATRGKSFRRSSIARPAFAATTSIAASVGSPAICHRCPSGESAASLHTAPATSVQRNDSSASTDIGWPSPVTSAPVGA